MRNATHKCVIVIEVKNTLGSGKSVTKSIEQLLEVKDDLEAWFATEGLQLWRFISMIYAEEITIEIKCSTCKQYVIKGMNRTAINLGTRYHTMACKIKSNLQNELSELI